MKAQDFKVGDKVETSSGVKGVVHQLHAKNGSGVRVTIETEHGGITSKPYWELKKLSA